MIHSKVFYKQLKLDCWSYLMWTMMVDTPVRKWSHKDKVNEYSEDPQNSKSLILRDISANPHSSQKV